MATVVKFLYQQLDVINEMSSRDQRISHWPMLGPPWAAVAAVVLYLAFVKRWGPAWMEKREPFEVKLPMQIYNVVQIVINAGVLFGTLRYMLHPEYRMSCQSADINNTHPATMNFRWAGYFFYVSRYLDFMDTIFFVLRKKNKQITFLHVYHHALMVFGVYVYLTFYFGSHYSFGGCLNSLVHVCMYTYYFVAALKLKLDLEPWKRRLTQMQMLQFSIITVHLMLPVLDNWCRLNMFWHLTALLQNVFLLVLFADFYYKTYIVADRRKAKKSLAEAPASGSVQSKES